MSTLLLIDDDADLRTATAQFLRQNGYKVYEACDGRQGLKLFPHVGADLVITDIFMPEMEGLELIARLRVVSPHLRVIATSGGSRFTEDIYLNVARKTGAQRTLAKPFRPMALLEAVAGVLAEPTPPGAPPGLPPAEDRGFAGEAGMPGETP